MVSSRSVTPVRTQITYGARYEIAETSGLHSYCAMALWFNNAQAVTYLRFVITTSFQATGQPLQQTPACGAGTKMSRISYVSIRMSLGPALAE